MDSVSDACVASELEPGLELPVDARRIQLSCADTDKMLVNATDAADAGLPLAGQQQEPRSVQCECCGMAEECTPTYIARVREHFHGRWVCGLCSEAVEERRRRAQALTVDEAVAAHAALCEEFNNTVRLNPKLSLASSMRHIARRSSRNRSSSSPPSAAFGGCKIGRSRSFALRHV